MDCQMILVPLAQLVLSRVGDLACLRKWGAANPRQGRRATCSVKACGMAARKYQALRKEQQQEQKQPNGGRGRGILGGAYKAQSAETGTSQSCQTTYIASPIKAIYNRTASGNGHCIWSSQAGSLIWGRKLPTKGAACRIDQRQELLRSVPLMLASGIFLALHFACWVWSIDHTSLPHALLFVSSTPVTVAAGMLLMRKPISWGTASSPRDPTPLNSSS